MTSHRSHDSTSCLFSFLFGPFSILFGPFSLLFGSSRILLCLKPKQKKNVIWHDDVMRLSWLYLTRLTCHDLPCPALPAVRFAAPALVAGSPVCEHRQDLPSPADSASEKRRKMRKMEVEIPLFTMMVSYFCSKPNAIICVVWHGMDNYRTYANYANYGYVGYAGYVWTLCICNNRNNRSRSVYIAYIAYIGLHWCGLVWNAWNGIFGNIPG